MRRQRRHTRSSSLIVLAAIPSVTGSLALTNFQGITIKHLPTPPADCLTAYGQPIPSCEFADFHTGCSQGCKNSLNNVAADVSNHCNGVDTPDKSLLALVRAGSVVSALCGAGATTTTTTTAPKPIPTSTSAEESVTIPTASPGVIVPTSSSSESSSTDTSTTETSSSSTDISTSTDSSSSSSSETSTSSDTSTTPTSTTTSESTTSTHESSTHESKTSSTQPAKTNTANGDNSGGGSPFDTNTNNSLGSRLQSPLWGVCIALAGVGYLLGR